MDSRITILCISPGTKHIASISFNIIYALKLSWNATKYEIVKIGSTPPPSPWEIKHLTLDQWEGRFVYNWPIMCPDASSPVRVNTWACEDITDMTRCWHEPWRASGVFHIPETSPAVGSESGKYERVIKNKGRSLNMCWTLRLNYYDIVMGLRCP